MDFCLFCYIRNLPKQLLFLTLKISFGGIKSFFFCLPFPFPFFVQKHKNHTVYRSHVDIFEKKYEIYTLSCRVRRKAVVWSVKRTSCWDDAKFTFSVQTVNGTASAPEIYPPWTFNCPKNLRCISIRDLKSNEFHTFGHKRHQFLSRMEWCWCCWRLQKVTF